MSDLRIHTALAPRVAVLSSPDVDRVIQLNGIPDLPTLLRPFEFSVERLSVRTSQLETRVCDRFPLRFDPYSLFNPDAAHAISSSSSHPQPRPSAVGRSTEELLDRVNHLIATNIKKWDAQAPRPSPSSPSSSKPAQTLDRDGNEGDEKDRGEVLDETLAKLQRTALEESTPWFAAVQQLVFSQRSIAKHESFGHPVAVLLAVSSASPDPMNDFAKLYETSSQPQPFPGHPYINPDTLKYYVLIHDVRTSGSDLSGSKEILEQIKKTYGLHCCLLAINSAEERERGLGELWKEYLSILPSSPTSPIPDAGSEDVARYLDQEDVKRIKNFIRELTAQSIVPFMERYVQHMGEYLANSRKGLTNRIFGASRKFFGSSSTSDKSTTGLATSGGYDAQLEYYPYSSIEAQTRRLADFAFTTRDYKLAASMYDLGRRDFAGDKAHRHTAGATEMFGLSHLMQMFASRGGLVDVDSYLAQACSEYSLRSSSTNPGVGVGVEESYPLRAALLYYEAYRLLNYLRPAPAGLLRMAMRSEEVLAPLLLEQAALACLQMQPKPALRKYALHLVNAGHRYQSCGQKLLSLRCYAQAAQVYRGKSWVLIENHIERELGMQAYNEGDSEGAVAHLLRLIRASGNEREEHEGFLSDVSTAYRYSKQAGEGGALELEWEMFDVQSARLGFGGEGSGEVEVSGRVWEELEQRLVDTGLGERVLQGGERRRRKRPVGKGSAQGGEVAMGQSFWLDVVVRNPLTVEMAVDSIKPVLQLDGQSLSAEEYDSDPHPPLTLGPMEQRPIRLSIRVNREAKQLRVASLTFRLAETIQLTQKLHKKGKRLNGTKDQRTTVSYAPDTSLALTVHGTRPTLMAQMLDAPKEVYLGEERRVKVVLRNEGNVVVDDVRAICSQPSMASFASAEAGEKGGEEVVMPNNLSAAVPQFVLDKEGETKLEPGEEREVDLIIRPTTLGEVTLAWLLAFSPADGEETYLSRLALSTHVEAAVQVSVETKPRRGGNCEHDVMVEVTNRLSRQEVRLDALSMLSPRWSIRAAKEGAREGILIAPRQAWRGRLTISPQPTAAGAEEGERYTETKLQDLLLSRDTKRPPVSDVTLHYSSTRFGSNTPARLRASLYGEGRKVWRKATLSTAFPTVPSRDREAIFTVFSASEVDLSAHFSLPSSAEDRKGQITVFGLKPGPSRSSIRAITHPNLDSSGTSGSKVRSLYAQTVREKASLLQNILSSRLSAETNPVVVHTEAVVGEKKGAEKVRFVVRNFGDLYEAQVQVQVQLQDGSEQGESAEWVGRKTLRCEKVAPGETRVLEGRRRIDDGEEGGGGGGGGGGGVRGGVRFGLCVETYLPSTTGDGGGRVLVGRYTEQH